MRHDQSPGIATSALAVTFCTSGPALWKLAAGGRRPRSGLAFAAPTVEIDGAKVVLRPRTMERSGERWLTNGSLETVFTGNIPGHDGLRLDLVVHTMPANPVVRFRYRVRSDIPRALTRSAGRDPIEYARFSLRGFPVCREVRFSEFDESIHSFRLTELDVAPRQFENNAAVMGPLLAAEGRGQACLVAYEHGSQVPDAFLQFHLAADRTVALRAVKGNCHDGQPITPEEPFETLWFHAAAAPGSIDELAGAYREFVLRGMTENRASRQPYIFYNTWCFQERNKWWGGKKYLDSMNLERMLQEIDVAGRMGIEVFVLDTGWYSKTGDWDANRAFFPDALKRVKAELDRRGMKLGLWFSPTQAAVSSRLMQKHPDCRMMWDGKPHGPFEVWETEASYHMCLVSPYWESFADELIRLARDVGVTYFKWDAVGQYGCNDPRHAHGTEANTPQERADRYAFEMGRYMIKVVNKLCAACPEAIVDFDITEGGRFVGLGFLAAGKYFLINNGPYYPSFDHPYDWGTATNWSNVFVHPGPARARICRAPLDFDKWLPSVLFLTHYLPDDPEESQIINLASLILGQSGIWGDLPAVSPEGVARFGRILGLYKQVREDMTQASPVRFGICGGSPEVHEKINPATGRGAVCVFAAAAGRYTYITANRVEESTPWHTDGVTAQRDAAGRAVLTLNFGRPGAHVVLFGLRHRRADCRVTA